MKLTFKNDHRQEKELKTLLYKTLFSDVKRIGSE